MTEDVHVYFVIPISCGSHDDCPEDMQQAFNACEQHRSSGMLAEWMAEDDCMTLGGLTKRDVFVLQQFSGPVFDKLKKTKCLIVGPRCLLCCLTEGTQIPPGPDPVFTVAMRGLVVTASGFSKAHKDEIRQKVQWMGGMYSNVLTDATTHLVADTVLSDKYIKAAEKRLPIMSVDWIKAVWQTSLELNVSGTAAQFECHRLPPFAGLTVTSTNLSRADKLKVTKLVNEFGGTYSGPFESNTTNLLVLNRDGVSSKKYISALEYKMLCVIPSWIYDSVKAGYAVGVQQYKVSGASTSSPLSSQQPNISLDFSRISHIGQPAGVSGRVDETEAFSQSNITQSRGKNTERKKRNGLDSMEQEIANSIDNLDPKEIKSAGPILDGYCVYICGLEGVHRERAAACVSRCGGVRYDSAHERVTVVAAGTRAAAVSAARDLPQAIIVSAAWLVDSVRAKRALSYNDYIIRPEKSSVNDTSERKKCSTSGSTLPAEPASPMSKRNLQLLSGARPPVPLFKLDDDDDDKPGDDIMKQYLDEGKKMQETTDNLQELTQNTSRQKSSKNETEADQHQPQYTKSNKTTDGTESSTIEEDPTEEIEQIFKDISIEVQGMDEEAVLDIAGDVSAAGGRLVAAGAGGAYVIVPLDFHERDVINTMAEVVTIFWLKDCCSQSELLPVEYYHKPVSIPDWIGDGAGPLAGVVLSISTYTDKERMFLDELAELLGATTQLRFCRRTTATATASTHLLCPAPTGEKYAGACRWGLPAVTGHWLMACAEAGRRVREDPFLVGDTKAPVLTESITEGESSKTMASGDAEMKITCAANEAPAGSQDNTPSSKFRVPLASEGDMSPASRYIAMARQGLLGADTQETPKRVQDLRTDNANIEQVMKTPPLEDALATPNLKCLSPTTRRRLQAIKRGEMPSDPPKTPRNPFESTTETPESPFGAALRPDTGRMSNESRKKLWNLCEEIPGGPPREDKNDTPLSEICNRYLSRYNPETAELAPRQLHIEEDTEMPPKKMAKFSVDQQRRDIRTIESRLNDSTDNLNLNRNRQSLKSDQNIRIATLQRVSSAHKNSIDEENKSKNINSTKIGDVSKQKGGKSEEFSVDIGDQLLQLSSALQGFNARTPGSSKSRRGTGVQTPPTPVVQERGEDVPENLGYAPESQTHTVGWDDTSDFNMINSRGCIVGIRKFMMSSNVDNRDEISAMVLKLGGEASVCNDFESSATHLLCAAPARSEKMLASVAAGKWVLHPAYVVRSNENGAWLPEEQFEWGNPLATVLPATSEPETALALAAHRWRSRRSAGAGGPFANVRAILHARDSRREQLARLLRAGDGTVLDVTPPYTCEEATYCLVEMRRFPMETRDLQWLHDHGVPVCQPVFLSTCLVDPSPPCPLKHAIPEYKALNTSSN